MNNNHNGTHMRRDDLEAHWEMIYAKEQIDKLGWYEKNPAPSLELIANDLSREALENIKSRLG